MPLSLTQPPPVGVPSRFIALWGLNFDVGTYPDLAAWALCDGANGTPDMRRRLARGVPALGVVGAVGGTEDHCHGISVLTNFDGAHDHAGSDILPYTHDHPMSETDQYCHDHAGSAVAPCWWVHSHLMSACQYPLTDYIYCSTDQLLGMADPDHIHQIANTEASPNPAGAHSHCFVIEQDQHQHDITVVQDCHTHVPDIIAVGTHRHAVVADTGTRADLWPPYRNLHFIMKL